MSSLASLLWAAGFHLLLFGADIYLVSEQCLYIACFYHFLIEQSAVVSGRGSVTPGDALPRGPSPRGPLGAGVPSQACSTPFTVCFCL